MSSYDCCPICMDEMDPSFNHIITDCGHHFHAKCMIECVDKRGFKCPCCRNKLIEDEKRRNKEYEDEDEYYDDDDDEENDENVNMYYENNYLTRGFRLFWNNINGIQHEEVDLNDEENEEDNMSIDDDTDDESNEAELLQNAPPVGSIIDELREKITFEDLATLYLTETHDEYYYLERTSNRISDKIYGETRKIISRFKRNNRSNNINNTL